MNNENELNIVNTIGLCDAENFLMKPINDYTFMTLFKVANYFDMYRISPIICNHLIDNFIVQENVFYEYLQKIKYKRNEEFNYEKIIEHGYQKNYVFDNSFIEIIQNDQYENIIQIEKHDFSSTPPITNDMEDITMVKAYAHIIDKITQKDFNYVFNEHYAIQFIKNIDNQYFIVLEFSKSYTYEMVSKSIYFVNQIIENEIENFELIDNFDNINFMKPIHNKLLFSIIDFDNIELKNDISTEIIKNIYNEEFVLDEEEYNTNFDYFEDNRKSFNNYSKNFDVSRF